MSAKVEVDADNDMMDALDDAQFFDAAGVSIDGMTAEQSLAAIVYATNEEVQKPDEVKKGGKKLKSLEDKHDGHHSWGKDSRCNDAHNSYYRRMGTPKGL